MDLNELNSFYEKINSAMIHSKEYQEKINQLKLNVREEVRPIVVQEKLDKIKELEDITHDLDEMTKNDIDVFNNEVSQTLSNNSQKLVDYQNKLAEEKANYANERKNLMDRHSRLFLNKRNASDEMVISAFQKAVENLKTQHEQKMQNILDSIKKINDENKTLIDYSQKMSQPFPILMQNLDEQKSPENSKNLDENVEKNNKSAIENAEKKDNEKNQTLNNNDKKYEIIVAPNQNKEFPIIPATQQQKSAAQLHNPIEQQPMADFDSNAENNNRNNRNSLRNYIKLANGELDMSIGKSDVSIDLDEIDNVLDEEKKNLNKAIKEKYISYSKNANLEKLSDVKYLILEIKNHSEKMLKNMDIDEEKIDPNIYKGFQLSFLNSVKNGIKNGIPLEIIKNDINNIDKYFDKYVNCVKTNQKDSQLQIEYDVRYGGFLTRKDFSTLKKYAKNARAFANVKAGKFTKFSWRVQDKIASLVNKMKSQKLLSDATVVANQKETQNGSSKDYQAKNDSSKDSKTKNDLENNIEKSLNEYIDNIINNEHSNNEQGNNQHSNNQHSNNELEELKVDTINNHIANDFSTFKELEELKVDIINNPNFSDKNDQKNSSNNSHEQNKDEHNDNQSREIR